MDKITAAEFVLSCQKIALPKETLKMVIERYATTPVHILCLSKVSGRKEMMSMLADFSFLVDDSADSLPEEEIKDSMLSNLLLPIWNSE